MFKAMIFCSLLAMAFAQFFITDGGVPLNGLYATRSSSPAAGVYPLVYSRLFSAPVSAVPIGSGLQTYNSVQTPDSFQQQYRADYTPLAYAAHFP